MSEPSEHTIESWKYELALAATTRANIQKAISEYDYLLGYKENPINCITRECIEEFIITLKSLDAVK